MVRLEVWVSVLARGTLGVFFATVLSFIIWRMIWLSINTSDMRLSWFFLVQALIVGIGAAVGIVFAWWNTQSSGRVHWLAFVLTLGAAVAGAWLFNEVRGVDTHYALVRGVSRVQVFSIAHMVASMMFGAVVIGNAMAATLFIYRAVRHREV